MKRFFIVIGVIVTALCLHPSFSFGVKGHTVTTKTSLGYDDSFDQPDGPFLNLYVDSKFPLPQYKRLKGVFRLQNGFKILRETENTALNQVNLRCAFPLLSRLSAEILNELKHKSVQDDYGYLSYDSGLSLIHNGSNFNSSITYIYHQKDYGGEDYSDSKTKQIHFSLNRRVSYSLMGRFMGKWETIRFSGEEVTGKRIDKLSEFSLGFQWIDEILLNPSYAFQKNKSNDEDYSYYAHQLTILTVAEIWWEITMQFYGRFQLRKLEAHDTSNASILDDDTDNTLHNLFIFSLSKDVLENSSLELRYLLSQADLALSSEEYKKQTYSFAFTCSF
ncbi:MAG: hypothetical protein ACMUIP_10785 [bacterium]